MPSTISPLYVIYLLACAGILLALFRAYGKIFSRLLPSFDNISGGFLLFVAVNEVLAVPFTVLHGRFSHFLTVFVLVNLPILLLGLTRLYRARSLTNKEVAKSPHFILFAFVLLSALAMTQIYAYYSGDDSFYISLIEQNKGNDLLYSSDPSFGIDSYRFPQAYQFQGWELIESALSVLFRLTTLELVHGLVPLVILPTVCSGFKQIFAYFLDKKDTYFALTLLLFLFIFGGYSARSEGAFLMTRPWQGKTIVASLILPLLIFSLYRAYEKAKENDFIKFFLPVMVINIAALALNPSSVFICVGAMVGFGLMMVAKARNLWPALGMFVASLPFVPFAVYTFFIAEARGGARLEIRPFIDYLIPFIGKPWFFALWFIGLILLFRSSVMAKGRSLFYIFPVVVSVTVLNPLFYPYISKYITSTAYWRLFWLIPLTITLPIIGVLGLKNLKSKLNKHWGVIPARTLATFSIVLMFILGGRYVYGLDQSVVEVNLTREKVPKGVVGVSEFLAAQPKGLVLAAPYPAAYLHNFTAKHEVLAPRVLSLRVHFEIDSEGYNFRTSLLSLMSKKKVKAFPISRYHEVMRRYGVDYLVYDHDNQYIRDYVEAYEATELYSNERYRISKTDLTPSKH